MTEAEFIKQMDTDLLRTQERIARMQTEVAAYSRRSIGVKAEIDAMPGRRVAFALSGRINFTDTTQRAVITLEPSQDGAFVLTHYPVISWAPSSTTATLFGMQSPIRTWPLPTQQVNTDRVDVGYEISDAGSERLLQTTGMPTSAQLISTGDNIIPMAMPTVFPSNTRISVAITFYSIYFYQGDTPTTQGTMQVDLLGYRIVSV